MIVIVMGTVNELLLGQGCEALILDEHVGLESSDSGEGPATSARTLILNWRDTFMISPVKGFWDIDLALIHMRSLCSRAVLILSKPGFIKLEVVDKLLLCQVRELVDTLFIGLARLAIMVDHSLDALSEGLHSIRFITVGVW